jgi:hypothetical protein
VSLFVVSPEIEDRDKVETGRSTKRPSTLHDIIYYFIFKLEDKYHFLTVRNSKMHSFTFDWPHLCL